MSVLKYFDRFKKMDDLIYRKSTGTAEEFASSVGISVSVLKDHLDDMRALGAEVVFCRSRKTYYYKNECRLIMKFQVNKISTDDSIQIKGGIDFPENLFCTVFSDGSGLCLLQHSF